MFPKKESLVVEFKSDRKKLDDTDMIETIVGFANTKGGTLYIGIEDNGVVTGVHPSHKNIIGLAAVIANNTIPPQSVRVDCIDVSDKQVVTVEVASSTSIVSTSSGKTLRRRMKLDGTPETVPMYPHEFTTRLSGLSLLDYSSQIVIDATADDFDPLERERLRNIVRMYRGEATLLELSDEELDRALQFVKRTDNKDVPTVTGLLTIGKADSIKKLIPTAGLAFQVLSGSDVRVNEFITKPILATFDMVQEYMKAWNPEQEAEVGMYRISIPDFDHRAFREAIVNAFSHRDYSILQRIRIQIDNDGMSIASPGGFVEGVSLDNLLTTEPRSRNPDLADALKRIGLAERTGRGIDRIYEGSLFYGRPLPDYSGSDSTSVRLFISRANPDKFFTQMIAEAMNNKQIQLNVFSMMILNYLRCERRADVQSIEENTGIDKARIRSSIERLVEAGYVEASGTGRGRTYLLSSKVYRAMNNTKAYVRQTDIYKIRHPELVLKLIRNKGSITRRDVVELLHITAPQAYRLLKKMADQGDLVMNGTKNTAVYQQANEDRHRTSRK
ncbi:MAG: putative DNA binding domain-containing protein [Bacillota bacterium]|nr:putative DNA binding domain-containing protein [Bacillota bacterium]